MEARAKRAVPFLSPEDERITRAWSEVWYALRSGSSSVSDAASFDLVRGLARTPLPLVLAIRLKSRDRVLSCLRVVRNRHTVSFPGVYVGEMALRLSEGRAPHDLDAYLLRPECPGSLAVAASVIGRMPRATGLQQAALDRILSHTRSLAELLLKADNGEAQVTAGNGSDHVASSIVLDPILPLLDAGRRFVESDPVRKALELGESPSGDEELRRHVTWAISGEGETKLGQCPS